jgi:hypothetical protein
MTARLKRVRLFPCLRYLKETTLDLKLTIPQMLAMPPNEMPLFRRLPWTTLDKTPTTLSSSFTVHRKSGTIRARLTSVTGWQRFYFIYDTLVPERREEQESSRVSMEILYDTTSPILQHSKVL